LNLAVRIPATFEAKGWALYRAPEVQLPERDLPRLISSGRTTCLESDVGYCVLPIAQRHDNPDDVIRHMEYAHNSDQLPTLRHASKCSGQVAWLVLRDESLDIELANQGHTYSFKHEDVLDTIHHRLSNYNIHYFESIEELRSFVGRTYTDPRIGARHHRGPRWRLVDPHPQEGLFKLYPADPPDLLFRGQTRRYRPCLPTIVRGFPETTAAHQLSESQKACLILNLTRTFWFNQVLRETPAMRWMSQQQVAFDETAAAQHYGLPTGYIDLSESLEVASFFACWRFDHGKSSWEPVAEGEGVVYAVDRKALGIQSPLRPIALQPFPRPSEQWGWVQELSLGEDFDALPHVRKMIFKHDYELSETIAQRLDNGRVLFPPDPLSDLADVIRTSKALPISTLTQVATDLSDDPLGLPGITCTKAAKLIEQHAGVSCAPSLDPLNALGSLRARLESNWANKKTDFPPPFDFQLVGTVRDADAGS